MERGLTALPPITGNCKSTGKAKTRRKYVTFRQNRDFAQPPKWKDTKTYELGLELEIKHV